MPFEAPTLQVPWPAWRRGAPWMVAGTAFLVLFWSPVMALGRDWWHDPDAGHGLLLAPLALWIAWKRGIAPRAAPQAGLGLALLGGAVLLRYLSGLAAELYTMRLSMLGAVGALVVFAFGVRQLLHWWLPAGLLALSVPLPGVVLGTLALPLQLQASRIGAALLEWRHVPVMLAGNQIFLPGRVLFVTEACSGLRSLAALVSLALLIGGLWLRLPLSRLLLVALAVPVAVLLNGLRVFLTGFLVYFVDPALGDGFIHYTEGWIVFMVAFLVLGGVAWGIWNLEETWKRRG